MQECAGIIRPRGGLQGRTPLQLRAEECIQLPHDIPMAADLPDKGKAGKTYAQINILMSTRLSVGIKSGNKGLST